MFDREKFKSLVHYVCWSCEDPTVLGSVKLNKVLYKADFAAYYRDSSITGEEYVKRQYGPVPKHIVPILRELAENGDVAIRDAEHFGYDKKEFFAITKPDLSRFTAEEISIVDEMILYVCYQHTARSISKELHDEVWELAEIGEEIPYVTAFSRPGEITEMDIEWARMKIEEFQGA
jgi:hypothetical protein